MRPRLASTTWVLEPGARRCVTCCLVQHPVVARNDFTCTVALWAAAPGAAVARAFACYSASGRRVRPSECVLGGGHGPPMGSALASVPAAAQVRPRVLAVAARQQTVICSLLDPREVVHEGGFVAAGIHQPPNARHDAHSTVCVAVCGCVHMMRVRVGRGLQATRPVLSGTA